ncbi:hypothetical protein M758_UG085400 [Ceratodon purpureus]|nr:hypothetical protein M758_UG085400 [Ceratodon purpureus]
MCSYMSFILQVLHVLMGAPQSFFVSEYQIRVPGMFLHLSRSSHDGLCHGRSLFAL